MIINSHRSDTGAAAPGAANRELERRTDENGVEWVWATVAGATGWHSRTEMLEHYHASGKKETEVVSAPPASDLINQPKHYTSHPSGIECIQITEHMSFNLGNAMKYLWRADKKGAPLDDLKKAAWYINREIEKREKA